MKEDSANGDICTLQQVPVINTSAGLKRHTYRSEAQCFPLPFVSSLVYECSHWVLRQGHFPLMILEPSRLWWTLTFSHFPLHLPHSHVLYLPSNLWAWFQLTWIRSSSLSHHAHLPYCGTSQNHWGVSRSLLVRELWLPSTFFPSPGKQGATSDSSLTPSPTHIQASLGVGGYQQMTLVTLHIGQLS